MAKEKNSLPFLIMMIVLFLIVVGGASYFAVTQYVKDYNAQLAQNNGGQQQEPQSEDPTLNWNSLGDSRVEFKFKYPKDFFDQTHEPKLLIGDCSYAIFPDQCPDIKNIVAQDNDAKGNYVTTSANTSKTTINNTPYCATEISDAASGSLYNYYYFTTTRNQKCLVVYLATSSTNCNNYLPLETGNTEQKQNYDDCIKKNNEQPKILEQIANTFELTGE